MQPQVLRRTEWPWNIPASSRQGTSPWEFNFASPPADTAEAPPSVPLGWPVRAPRSLPTLASFTCPGHQLVLEAGRENAKHPTQVPSAGTNVK